MTLHHDIITKGMHDLMWRIRQCVHMQKNVINTPKISRMSHMYDAKVAPTILDGGNDFLLANFHRPRSLKCATKDGGLAKPTLEHTYAVVTRDFLCDCQVDLEYISVLKQISACGEKTKYDMTLWFTVNLVFWQLLKQYKPKLATTINLDLKRIEQTFPVRLFDNTKGPLQIPAALPDIVKRLNDDGRKFKQTGTNYAPIFSKYESNIMTMVTEIGTVYRNYHRSVPTLSLSFQVFS